MRLLALAAILCLLLVFAIRAADSLAHAGRAVTFPYGLDYGEGTVWQQALMIPGPNMYGDITHPPFIVFEYPPVYHLLVRALVSVGIDPLAAGRSISLAATIVIAVLIGNITFAATRENSSTKARILGSILAGLIIFPYRPVEESAVWMHVDVLAIGFSFAGIYMSIVAGYRIFTLCIAVLLFSFAVYTKQTELSAPIATFLIIATVDRRSALQAVIFGSIISGAALTVLLLITNGGFWRHIIEYNRHNRFVFDNIPYLLSRQRRDAAGLVTGFAAFAFLWWREATSRKLPDLAGWFAAIRESEQLRALSIISLWFVLASAQLVTLGRPGAWDNYFVEWMCITAVPIGMAAVVWTRLATKASSALFPGLAGLLCSLALATQGLHRWPYELGIVDNPRAAAVRRQLVDLIRASRKPVISDDMVLILRAGKHVFIEPAIFTELADTGYWDQGPLLKLIQNHAFALVITQTVRMQDEVAGGVFTDEVAHAIESSYPFIERLDNYVIRRP